MRVSWGNRNIERGRHPLTQLSGRLPGDLTDRQQVRETAREHFSECYENPIRLGLKIGGSLRPPTLARKIRIKMSEIVQVPPTE